jgi:hypothetical protein
MKSAQYISEENLFRKAVDILMDKLGPVETTRFLAMPAKK